MIEVYEKWMPVPEMLETHRVEGLCDDWEGFRLILCAESGSNSHLRVRFPSHIAYRNTNEGDRLSLWGDDSPLKDKQGHTFFTVKNSLFVDWFHEQNLETVSKQMIRHYSFLTTNDCVDVLTFDVPIVEILPLG